MSQPTPSLDLTSCDREPIHVPGSIQPHGILLSLDPETLIVHQAAGETRGAVGRVVDRLPGEHAEAVLGGQVVHLIRSAGMPLTEPLYLGAISAPADPCRHLDVTAHQRDGVLILELEPSTPHPETAAQTLATVRRISAELDAAPNLARLIQVASREFRRLTGFDRVMIYRFLDDGSGAVVAEAKADNLDPFLNHRYPASDIPKQARALYLQNLIRVIPDVDYRPDPLVPPLNPATGKPLDMSDCSLRSVSPIHVQYLKNMGVAASMSVSLVVDGALWGLIACHHASPKLVPCELRESCKHVGQILSQQIKAREDAELHRQTARLTTVREKYLEALVQAASIEQGLLDAIAPLTKLVPCDGAAVVVRDRVSQAGHAPSEAETRALADWLLQHDSSRPYATNSLVRHYSPAAAYAEQASGVLATVMSREEPVVLLWFRAEHIETINWAGNPHKPAEPGGGMGQLSPRSSFETWKETVRHQSRAWSLAEIEAVARLRRAVLDLSQQATLKELNVQLRRSLADKEALLSQKDLLMQEVHHRVQNSLQLVNSMLQLQARQTSDAQVKAQFEEATRRIMAVSTVHQRLWRSDQIQSIDFGSYLEELREGLLEAWGKAWAEHIKVHAGQVLVPTNEAVVLALVVTELLTNAVKYAYGGATGPIDVIAREDVQKVLRVTVQDQGMGMPPKVTPKSGLGSRLVRSLIGQLGGELEVESQSTGTKFILTVPLAARANQ
ncbi:histidine kinase dimerization/phosphoacceptor domain -containing protein [Microvirga mediterraneensis]|uniref:GAF domain-containing protein n=1 Tax=Microvirga mediterraneensis TaxID=2754695 RepID=A0A838BVM7_9HYPH|nr:histidine kinase dimerization/phosphoacceptor domain -containing protein [Microvirga mediterraneensis]MBA1159408.1 GAF domain-containing protein [Microvirga mediterraneensis]